MVSCGVTWPLGGAEIGPRIDWCSSSKVRFHCYSHLFLLCVAISLHFYHRLLCQRQNKSWAWPIVADPSRGEGVGRSDESSFRNDQNYFCAKFRVLCLIGLALGPGLNWPSGWPSCPGQRPFHCHEQPPRRGTTLLDGQRSRGRPHLACWADIAAGRRPKQRCSTAAPRGGAPTRRRRSRRTATATATPS